MKIVIAAAPRTGSHAFSNIQPVDIDLSEIMNIEDMLLPRLEDDSIDFSICSTIFLDAIEKHNWELAWNNKPEINKEKHHFLGFSEDLEKIRLYSYPSFEQLLAEQQLRWTNIQNLHDSWCIKIIMYQSIPENILHEMITMSDKTYVLKRKDKVQQAISMTKATQSQLWHNEKNNQLDNNIGDIDYKIFSKCCYDVRKNDKWLDEEFSFFNPETVYYEDLDLSNSDYVKNNISMNFDLKKCQELWEASSRSLSTWYKEFIGNYNWDPLYELNPENEYFRGITDLNYQGMYYWNVHLTALNSIGIDHLDKNIKWLDIGVWFGIMPFIVKEYGFVNVETTDCKVHREGYHEYFDKLWNAFGISPQELEIRPHKKFELDKKYDLITIMKSNVFWKTEEVVHYDNNEINTSWQNKGEDGKTHTYFTLYNKQDWEFFVENIREYLTDDGVAVVNPDPWAYDKIPAYHETRDYLKQFQTDNIPVDNPYIDYLVIRK